MSVSKGSGNPQRDLNHSSPAANVAKLGDRLFDLIANVNLLTAKVNALTTALNAASGAVIPSLAAVTALVSPAAIPTMASSPAPEIKGDLP
jgi:hypothetical protein